MSVTPYLFFNGRCDEAIAFYKKTLGAKEVMLLRFKQAPDQNTVPPGMGEKIMHARLEIGGTVIFLSDGMCSGQQSFDGFSLSLTVADEAEAEQRFNALAGGGQVRMPLDKTFFSPRFGAVADKFGVGWMVYVEPKDEYRPA